MAQEPVVLLDATDHARRIAQVGGPLVGGVLIVMGLSAGIVFSGTARLAAGAAVVAGLVCFGWGFQKLVRWEVDYKGHRIRLQNSVVFGERLYIEEERFQDDVAGYPKVLSGEIRSGVGAGDRIIASMRRTLFSYHCRIHVEPAVVEVTGRGG